MKGKLLIIDDEMDLCELLSLNLSTEGYIVTTAGNAAEGWAKVLTEKPDLVLLDVLLPDVSGVKLAARLKNNPETSGIPVILLTAKDSETDVIIGLSVGADDYITKPFSTAVLVARVEAVLRRYISEQQNAQKLICAGPVKILPASRQVFIDNKQIELTGSEYHILLALMEAAGAILSRGRLKEIPDAGLQGQSERAIDVHIAALRKKLAEHRNLIKTIHGLGYRLNI